MTDKTFTYGPSNVDQLLSTTLSAYVSENLNDQIFNAKPFLQKLQAKSQSKDGGASLLIPAMYAVNSTAGSYDEYDVLDVTPQDGFTNTQAKWKNLAASITISGAQLRKNSGASQVVSLLSAKTKQATESLTDLITTQLFAASSGTKDITGLPTMIDATSTVQDVNSTNASWWQSTVTTGGSFATQGLDDMRTTQNTLDTYNPSSMIDCIVTSSTVYNYLEASLTAQTRYAPGVKAEGSFAGLLFRGAEVFFDSAATADAIYMFSSDDMFLCINSNANMMTTEFVKPSNQDAKTAQIILMAELVTRARRKLGKITSITA